MSQPMIFVDTHVVVWLFYSLFEKLSERSVELINNRQLLVSPMTVLELEYLKCKKQFTHEPHRIINQLQDEIGLKISRSTFDLVIDHAVGLSWTRDPFDRLITAEASMYNFQLLTADQRILDHYKHAVWN